jgi:uncharacterized membrane protein
VTLPIGAFFLALVGDVLFVLGRGPFWYRFAFASIGIGILAAIPAAVTGLIEYFGVKMSAAGGRLATWHLGLNVSALLLYAVSFWLRRERLALNASRWPLAFGLEIAALAILGSSGWIGGKLTFEHKVGVVEQGDIEATELGLKQAS